MKYDPLPVLSHEAQVSLKEFAVTDKLPLIPGALNELFEKGLVCDNDGEGLSCDPYITKAGYAYLQGRRLPSIVIPDYYTGEIDDSEDEIVDECPDPHDDTRHDFPPMGHPYWDVPL